jgi:hypothetical protein
MSIGTATPLRASAGRATLWSAFSNSACLTFFQSKAKCNCCKIEAKVLVAVKTASMVISTDNYLIDEHGMLAQSDAYKSIFLRR